MATNTMSTAVVIPTRDRAGLVVGAVSSVLAGSVLPRETFVVDQSRERHTRSALETYVGRSGVRYLPSETVGISAGLNVGISATNADVIAITGDDCEVSREWLSRIVEEFDKAPATGVILGRIAAGHSPDGEGFNPSYEPPGRVVVRHARHRYRVGGTTACMAIRREVWTELGGFDEVLGVGAAFGAAEDVDFAIRALRHGWHILEDPGVEVVHHGCISWEQRAALIQRNWFGTGAALAKPVREGRRGAWITLIGLGGRWVFGGSRIARGLGGGPHRTATAAAFLRGFWAGVRRPLDEAGRFESGTGVSEDPPLDTGPRDLPESVQTQGSDPHATPETPDLPPRGAS